MEIKITTKHMLQVLHLVSWIIFVGLCITACGILFNAIFTLMINPMAAKKLWQVIDLSNLLAFDKGHFMTQTLLISIVAIMKALLFYLIIKILSSKKFNLKEPFHVEMQQFISNMAYLAIGIGLFSDWGSDYAQWLISKGVTMPDAQHMEIGGADVWLFMGIILLVITQIFKRGVEMQSENELTI